MTGYYWVVDEYFVNKFDRFRLWARVDFFVTRDPRFQKHLKDSVLRTSCWVLHDDHNREKLLPHLSLF